MIPNNIGIPLAISLPHCLDHFLNLCNPLGDISAVCHETTGINIHRSFRDCWFSIHLHNPFRLEGNSRTNNLVGIIHEIPPTFPGNNVVGFIEDIHLRVVRSIFHQSLPSGMSTNILYENYLETLAVNPHSLRQSLRNTCRIHFENPFWLD